MSNQVVLWKGPDGISLPTNARDASDIVPYASSLNAKQQDRIIKAFEIEAYDMAAEYAWKKAIVKLKETLYSLGMKFIGEMLGRDDIDESTPVDSILTEYTTIQLAEQLGIIGQTAALHLRQSLEIITHYFSEKTTEEIDFHSSLSVVKSSIKYVLGYKDVTVAIQFSRFRDRILNETVKSNDPQLELLINSPLFYTRTVFFVLLTAIKNDRGAKQEHALANFNLLTPLVWQILSETDKWNIGSAYRDVIAEGNNIAASGIKNALLKVNGFDYVPENLRSNTFKKAARNVIETHFAFNNFYNEPAAVKNLASLGTSIPAPALLDCIQAYLIVCVGSRYGVSGNAQTIAEKELAKLTRERWHYYFEKGIQNDETVLANLETPDQISRFSQILIHNNVDDFKNLPVMNQRLYDAIVKRNSSLARSTAFKLYQDLKSKE